MDGWITLGTKLDTKDLEKELKSEISNLNKLEKQNEVLVNARVKLEKSKAMKEYEQLRKAIEQSYATKIDMTYQGSDKETEARIREKLIAKEKEEIAKLNEAYAEQFQELKKINNQLEENNKQQELSKQNIAEINEKLTKSRGYDNIKESINDIGKGTEKVTKKVGRWALAIIGIRSAFFFIRQSISTLSEYNEKLANDIKGIRYALASMIEPIIQWIINLVKKLIGYLGYIIKAWTGKDIFAGMNKNLKKANGQAKELQKTLAGFDEMNVLQDNKSSGASGGSTSGMQMPTEVPGWVEWIGKNGKLVLSIFSGIAAAIIAMKLGLKGIKALGIGVLVAGIVSLIQDIMKYIQDPSWDNFADILIDIGVILAGLALLIGGWPLALAAAITLMVGLIAKFWDDIKEFLENIKTNVIKLGDDIKKWLSDHLGILGDILGVGIDIFVGAITGAIDFIVDLFDGLFGSIKDIIDGIIKICKGDLAGGLKNIFRGIANAIITVLNAIVDGLNIIFAPLRAIIMVAGNVLGKDWTMEDIKIPKIAKLARGGIVHSPGKGIGMGNYVVGEGSSPEAVLPLNDETLDRLGEKIAQHMSINADIKNYMNGRLISRELQKINKESNFAYNG